MANLLNKSVQQDDNVVISGDIYQTWSPVVTSVLLEYFLLWNVGEGI